MCHPANQYNKDDVSLLETPVTPSTETDMRVLLIFSMRWGASKFKVVCCMSWFNTNCWERED
jgi:hypothetical protein